MRKTFKQFGLAVVIAAIGFSIVSCGSDGGSDDGKTETTETTTPDVTPPPTATFAAIEFFPSSWGKEGEYSAEQWETNNQIKLSSFIAYKPKQGDVLTFKISGVSDKELKYIKIELGECVAGDWSTYDYLGSSWEGPDDGDLVNLSTSFTDVLINVPITEPTDPDAAIYAQLVNLLWEKDQSGEYVFNSGETLPAGWKKGDVMATVKNFTISLVGIDSSNNIDNNHGWSVWRDNTSTATLSYSIADDGVCTVTIGGTPEKHGNGFFDNGIWYWWDVPVWNAWKISAEYAYTGVKDTSYEYKFEAWTSSGTRDLRVQYYNNNDDGVYLDDTIPITTTRETYTVSGESLPKGGKFKVSFQLADQLGTVNLKMLEIKEYTP